MAQKKIQTTLTVEDKTFTNDRGESIAYKNVTVLVAGKELRVQLRKEDKALFEYLIEQVAR